MSGVSRRQFVQGVLGAGLLAGCGRLPWQAAGSARVPRIGYMGFAAPGVIPGGQHAAALADGLRELGYVEGHNLRVEWRPTGGRPERVQAVAAELAALQVDVIVVTGVI